MGGGMARRLVAKGHRVIGFDPSASAQDAFAAAGGQLADSPRAVADHAKIIFASLPSVAISAEVALGPEGVRHGRALRIYIETSTIGPTEVSRIADALEKEHGIQLLDAPVSGGPKGADEGTLTTVVAGPRDAFEEVRRYLEDMAAHIVYAGETPGLGQIYKIVNNYIVMSAMATTCEAIAVGVRCGADEAMLLDVINHSTGRNYASSFYFPAVVRPRAKIPSLRMAAKDVRLFCDLASQIGRTAICGGSILESWDPIAENGASMVDWYRSMLGEADK
jgi:3-hydroxyisobutyrate dehydrogenase-like beta-hydroxyacid dehydrogenase